MINDLVWNFRWVQGWQESCGVTPCLWKLWCCCMSGSWPSLSLGFTLVPRQGTQAAFGAWFWWCFNWDGVWHKQKWFLLLSALSQLFLFCLLDSACSDSLRFGLCGISPEADFVRHWGWGFTEENFPLTFPVPSVVGEQPSPLQGDSERLNKALSVNQPLGQLTLQFPSPQEPQALQPGQGAESSVLLWGTGALGCSSSTELGQCHC